MGKGNRNRLDRIDVVQPVKKKKKARAHKPLPKLLVPIVSIVLAVAIVTAIVLVSLVNNGTFKRNNILVKSQTGHYNVNQQMAYIMIWNSVYDQAEEVYNAYESYYEGLGASYTGYSTAFEYAWAQAFYAVKYNLNSYIEEYYGETLASYVAVCDYGETEMNLTLTEEEKTDAKQTLLSEIKSKAYEYYSYLQTAGLSSISPYYVYYSNYPYFGQFWTECFGKDITEQDMYDVAILEATAEKVLSIQQNGFWESDKQTVIDYREQNPESYYQYDLLSVTVDDEALANALLATNSMTAFQKLYIENYVEKNYLPIYNKYETSVVGDANTLKSKLTGKDATTLATALTENSLTATAYTKDSALDQNVKDWLFDSSREAFETTSVESEDGKSLFVVVISEISGDKNTVTAAYKKFDYTALDAATLDTIKNCVLIDLELIDGAGVTAYELSSVPANELRTKLIADGANRDQLFADSGKSVITCSTLTATTDGDLFPTYVRDAVWNGSHKAGDVFVLENQDGDGNSVVEVISMDETKANVRFVYFIGTHDKTVTDLLTAAEKALPSKQTTAYQKPADVKANELLAKLNAADDKADFMSDKGATAFEKITATNQDTLSDEVFKAVTASGVAAGQTFLVDKTDSTAKYIVYISEVGADGVAGSYLGVTTFEEDSVGAWLYECAEKKRTEGATKKITNDDDDETTYTVAMLLGTPKYLDESDAVRGGYAAFDDEASAKEAVEALKGLTGLDLVNKLYDINYNLNASNSLGEDDVTIEEAKAWLFDDARTANTVDIVKHTEDGTDTYYVVFFIAKMEAWEAAARTGYSSEKANEWIEQLVKDGGYTVSEKAIAKIHVAELETEAETTTAAQ